MGDYLSIANIFILLLAYAVKFVYGTLDKADSSNKDELIHRIENIEKYIERQIESLKEETDKRVDKLEENSRRDDDTVKELIKDSEDRMRGEIVARIRNIVELHQKTEKINENLLNKIEALLDRISNLEGKTSNK